MSSHRQGSIWKVGELLEPSETNDRNLAIADICLSNDGSLVAVAIQVITMEKSYILTSLASSFSAELLWTVMGASNMPNHATSQLLTRLRITPASKRIYYPLLTMVLQSLKTVKYHTVRSSLWRCKEALTCKARGGVSLSAGCTESFNA